MFLIDSLLKKQLYNIYNNLYNIYSQVLINLFINKIHTVREVIATVRAIKTNKREITIS